MDQNVQTPQQYTITDTKGLIELAQEAQEYGLGSQVNASQLEQVLDPDGIQVAYQIMFVDQQTIRCLWQLQYKGTQTQPHFVWLDSSVGSFTSRTESGPIQVEDVQQQLQSQGAGGSSSSSSTAS